MGIDLRATTSALEYKRWYLIPTVRILIVVDGNISLDNTNGFGLGKVIDALEGETFYSNVRFAVTGATRAGSQNTFPAATSKQFKYTGFKFNMAGFNINTYHQIWFFGFDPGNDASPNDANIDTISAGSNPNPLNDPAELTILSNWMNANKGGVLAMGDHHYLGASLCAKIPRVRKMRRWTNADHVPSISGPDRHDTNQPNAPTGEIPFEAQEDATPQPIEVLKKRYAESIFRTKAIPHPILCGADGVIDIFPDHPHEGEVLGTLYDTGTGGTPVDLTGNYPGATAEFPNAVSGGAKPEPQIIALGHPINTPRHDKNQPDNLKNPSHTNSTAPFGLANVYDGERAGVGRIVTDSTWHHWFNINLTALDTPAAAAKYRKIQNYYVNVAVWLCKQELRASILTTWTWGFLIREFDPMRFSVQDSIWRLGIAARDVLGRTATQCSTYEWIRIYIPQLVERFELPQKNPCLTCPPIDVFEIAMLGGIMKQMIPIVEKYRVPEKFIRQPLNVKEINEAIQTGIAKGYDELLSTLKDSIDRTNQLYKLAQTSLKRERIDLQVEMDTLRLKIVLESVLFNSPLLSSIVRKEREPFLVVSLANAFGPLYVNPNKIYLREKSTAQEPALYYQTDFPLIEDVFQDGETLFLKIYLNDEAMNERNKVYEAVLSGGVGSWLGLHSPAINELAKGNSTVGVWLNITEVRK